MDGWIPISSTSRSKYLCMTAHSSNLMSVERETTQNKGKERKNKAISLGIKNEIEIKVHNIQQNATLPILHQNQLHSWATL